MRRTSFLPTPIALLAGLAVTAALTVATPTASFAEAEPAGAVGPAGVAGPVEVVLDDTAQALEQAARALEGGDTAHVAEADGHAEGHTDERTEDPADHVEPTLALRDLFLARRALDDDQAREAERLLARPSDAADPYGDSYATADTKKCRKNICVHWVRTGADAPPSTAWVDKNLSVMQKVWRHHTGTLGYRTPAKDGKRGGNAKFDVYLKEIGDRGLFGYCAPERRVKGKPKQASGFCVLDNDFARQQFGRAPLKTLRVTAAHEFFHAIQFAYDYTEDGWLLESTATWIEERFADGVNDNRSYLQYGQAARSAKSLDLFEAGGLTHYGNWVFWEYLSERYGNDVVRAVLQRTGSGNGLPDEYSTQALRRVLEPAGGLPRQYAAFAAANTQPARSYDEGASFPGVSPIRTTTLRPGSPGTEVSTRVNHLAAKTVRFKPGGLKARKWRLELRVSAPAQAASPAAAVLVLLKDGTLVRRQVALDGSGQGRASLGFSSRKVRSVGVTLANASTRYSCGSGSAFACSGRPLDQRARFTLSATAVRG